MSVFLLAVFVGQLLVFFWAVARSGFMPFPHGLMLYCLGAQVALWLNAENIVFYAFLDHFSTGAYEAHFSKIFLLLSGFFLGSTICVPSTRANLSELTSRIVIVSELMYVAIIVLYLRAALHLLYIDWDVAIHNNLYLSMASATTSDGPLALFLTQSMFFSGIISVLIAAYSVAAKKWLDFVLVIPLVLWHFIFSLAGHSRQSTTYLVVAAIVLLLLRPKRLVLPIVLGFCALLALVGSLSGRLLDVHGFSSLPFFLTNLDLGPDSLGYITNPFEGAFGTAEYFAQSFTYPAAYKNLSLSPLFTFIDGFAPVRQMHEIRLAQAAPMPAVVEVLSFGPVHALIFFGVEFLSGLLSVRLILRRPTPVAVVLNMLVFLATYLQFAYPVRSVFRYFVMALLLSAYLLFFRSDRRTRAAASSEPPGSGPSAVMPNAAIEGARARRQARAAEATDQRGRKRRRTT